MEINAQHCGSQNALPGPYCERLLVNCPFRLRFPDDIQIAIPDPLLQYEGLCFLSLSLLILALDRLHLQREQQIGQGSCRSAM
jgi:hypothetical protein